MNTTTSIPTRIARALALAFLTVGLVGGGASAATSDASSALSLRGGGDDDAAGDDHGGGSSTSDDPAGDDHGGDGSGDGSGGGDDDDRVIMTGACSAGADWKLKVKTDDGRLEVEGEIDSNTVGEGWRWAIRHNGSVSDRGSATTTGRSGSFSIERKIVDIAGTDRVVFRAVHDGQTCRGVVNY